MNKLLSLTLMVVPLFSIDYLTSRGHGNIVAGWVLMFACGMLAGHIGRAR